MKTLVVNLFAGPGAGKTTCAWEIASELKKRNINTEYVPEYAKELVWDENHEALADQEHIFEVQANRINRLIGKVDVIVTDSPVLFSEIYGQNNSENFRKRIWNEHDNHYNFNLFINRGTSFQQQGRLHNLEESKVIDAKIKNMLESNAVYYGQYYHRTVPVIIDNIEKTLHRIQNETENTVDAEYEEQDEESEL